MPTPTRRQFCQTTLAGAATLALPRVVTGAKTDSAKPIVGVDGHRYEVDHHWAKLPGEFTWQTTHNVAVGADGLVYVIHEGRLDQKEHPAIFVFDGDGNCVRSFGQQFQGGGHGIETRTEGGEEFLYVCNYKEQRSFAKLTTAGEEVWRKGAPMESGVYVDGEDKFPRPPGDNPWDRDRFLPTNIAFHPDGGFYLADGYGAFCVHRYDAQGNWLSKFGGEGRMATRLDGEFKLPHGVWIDDRGDEPLVVVADRIFARLQWFTLEGEHHRTLDGFLLPANVDVFGDTMVVPDLVGRVTLLDKENRVIAQLGDDSERMQADEQRRIRGDESQWTTGKFVHPHDACFDAEGNLYVAEWVQRGRVTKLTRVE